jgi:hypothetical protein
VNVAALGAIERRLALALGVSLLAHAWLLHSHHGKDAARGHAAVDTPRARTLAARVLPAEEAIVAAPAAAVHETHVPPLTQVPAAAARNVVVAPKQTASTATPNAAGTPATEAALLAQPSDPTYYAAGELDVFPKALVKPDLGAALGAQGARAEVAAGKVRATVLIDEAGVVNAVRDVQAPASDVAATARELLANTRFMPARNKDGRIVKAQVRVELEYHAGDARPAPRAQ